MITFLNYLIEVNLGLVFFYAFYWLLLENENQFGFKRMYLIGSICASLLFPAFAIESQSLVLIPSISESVPAHWLPEITIYGDQIASEKVIAATSYWTWITYVYLAIAALSLVIFIFRLVEITRLYITANRYTWKNYTVAESTNVKGIFSFFQFIFLSPATDLDEQEKIEILRHEEVHIQKRHSLDILLITITGIVCWFNPVIRSYKKSLVQIHEFEADARSVESMDVDRYCGLLAKVALQTNGYVLANHFTNSLTLKRINMMKTVRKKIQQWKVVTVSVTALMIFFLLACKDQVISDIKAVGKSSTMAIQYPLAVQQKLDELKATNPASEFIVIEMNEIGKQVYDKLKTDKSFTENITSVWVVKQNEDENSFVIVGKGEQTTMISELPKSDGEVFAAVEESAHPAGGMTEFYNHVASEIKYPQEARMKGVEGRVFVEFIVNKDGSISNTQVIRGIGAGCDEEAARVVASAKPWQPGKVKGQAVKQRMVIPIIFQLENSTKKVELGQIPQNTMEEMVVVAYGKQND